MFKFGWITTCKNWIAENPKAFAFNIISVLALFAFITIDIFVINNYFDRELPYRLAFILIFAAITNTASFFIGLFHSSLSILNASNQKNIMIKTKKKRTRLGLILALISCVAAQGSLLFYRLTELVDKSKNYELAMQIHEQKINDMPSETADDLFKRALEEAKRPQYEGNKDTDRILLIIPLFTTLFAYLITLSLFIMDPQQMTKEDRERRNNINRMEKVLQNELNTIQRKGDNAITAFKNDPIHNIDKFKSDKDKEIADYSNTQESAISDKMEEKDTATEQVNTAIHELADLSGVSVEDIRQIFLSKVKDKNDKPLNDFMARLTTTTVNEKGKELIQSHLLEFLAKCKEMSGKLRANKFFSQEGKIKPTFDIEIECPTEWRGLLDD